MVNSPTSFTALLRKIKRSSSRCLSLRSGNNTFYPAITRCSLPLGNNFLLLGNPLLASLAKLRESVLRSWIWEELPDHFSEEFDELPYFSSVAARSPFASRPQLLSARKSSLTGDDFSAFYPVSAKDLRVSWAAAGWSRVMSKCVMLSVSPSCPWAAATWLELFWWSYWCRRCVVIPFRTVWVQASTESFSGLYFRVYTVEIPVTV